MQKTLILLKPDCVHRRLIGEVIQRFEQKGLRLAALKSIQAGQTLAEKHYAVHKGKPFYESLLQFLTSGPTVAMVWEGREAVAVSRGLIGPTDGTKAAPGTIRGDFAISVQNNLIHGSDSQENATLEIALWFQGAEMVSYTPVGLLWGKRPIDLSAVLQGPIGEWTFGLQEMKRMANSEPRNPFYPLLLLASLLFVITALAYAVVPTLEEKALELGQKPRLHLFENPCVIMVGNGYFTK